ncbi:MAG TPA: hypothetical protein VFN75_10885 [Pseudonocardiaceae bacterium]|nr:hypothetical protein [Pseudonocardiaceae bacterium]
MRKLTSALGVTALATLPLGLVMPSALADNPHTVVASCSQEFGPDSHGPGITFMVRNGEITVSGHCTNVIDESVPRAEKASCSDLIPGANGQFVLTPSGNLEGVCTFPQ